MPGGRFSRQDAISGITEHSFPTSSLVIGLISGSTIIGDCTRRHTSGSICYNHHQTHHLPNITNPSVTSVFSPPHHHTHTAKMAGDMEVKLFAIFMIAVLLHHQLESILKQWNPEPKTLLFSAPAKTSSKSVRLASSNAAAISATRRRLRPQIA
jgi:hypothetical protein